MVSRLQDDVVELKCGNTSAKIHLFGATVISWAVEGDEKLFISSKAVMDGTKAIRGGIPLVFPQFGPSSGRTYPLAQHGFARLAYWNVISKNDSSVLLELKSFDNAELFKEFPHSFTIQYRVSVTEKQIHMRASVFNTGGDDFSFDWLFHTYFRVDDVGAVKVGDIFNDYKCDAEYCQEFPIKDSISICSGKQSIELSVENMSSVVIWNPGPEKAALMTDLGRGEERTFICVEAGEISPPSKTRLSPGESISFEQILKCA